MIRKHSNQDSLVYKALMPLIKTAAPQGQGQPLPNAQPQGQGQPLPNAQQLVPQISAGDFVDFWSGGEHLFARVEKVKESKVTGTKVTVEAFLSIGKDMSVEDLRIRTLTRPLEYLTKAAPESKGSWTWGLTLRELYEAVVNR